MSMTIKRPDGTVEPLPKTFRFNWPAIVRDLIGGRDGLIQKFHGDSRAILPTELLTQLCARMLLNASCNGTEHSITPGNWYILFPGNDGGGRWELCTVEDAAKPSAPPPAMVRRTFTVSVLCDPSDGPGCIRDALEAFYYPEGVDSPDRDIRVDEVAS